MKIFSFTMRGKRPCVIVDGREYKNLSGDRINWLMAWCNLNSRTHVSYYGTNPVILYFVKGGSNGK